MGMNYAMHAVVARNFCHNRGDYLKALAGFCEDTLYEPDKVCMRIETFNCLRDDGLRVRTIEGRLHLAAMPVTIDDTMPLGLVEVIAFRS